MVSGGRTPAFGGRRDHSPSVPYRRGEWVRTTEHAPRDPFRVLESSAAEDGGVWRRRCGALLVSSHPERGIITLPENAPPRASFRVALDLAS